MEKRTGPSPEQRRQWAEERRELAARVAEKQSAQARRIAERERRLQRLQRLSFGLLGRGED